MDILTDAMANSAEIEAQTNRSSARNQREHRVNRHRYQIGVSQDAKVRELLRMASASTSRDKRRYLTPAGEGEVQRGMVTPPESARVAIDVNSDRKSLQLTPSHSRRSHRWHSNLDVLAGTPTQSLTSSETNDKKSRGVGGAAMIMKNFGEGDTSLNFQQKGVTSVRKGLAWRNYQTRCSTNPSPVTNFSHQEGSS